MRFEQHGYFKEYYIDGKFIGVVNDVEKDRLILGFFGQQLSITKKDILLSNKKKIKKGTIVQTQLHYLNGKMK